MSPLTIWGNKISDIKELQQECRSKEALEFGPEISAKDLGLETAEQQLQYFQDNAMEIKQKMQDCGAVIFRDFELMKTQDGFQDFYNAVGMKVCLDPLHSVSARPTVDGKKGSPVYEAVNKESRKNFFIGTCYLRLCLFLAANKSSGLSSLTHLLSAPQLNCFFSKQECTMSLWEPVLLGLQPLFVSRLPRRVVSS